MQRQQAELMRMLQSQAEPQLEFNCGRMTYDSLTKKVSADPRRGKLKVKKQPHQGTIKVEWSERNKNATDWNREFFGSSAKWIECTDTEARVFILMIDNRENFFWIQETDEEKDKEITEKFKELLGVSEDSNNNNNNNNNATDQNMLDAFRNAMLSVQPQHANQNLMQQLQEQMINDADLQDLFPAGEQLDTIIELLVSEEEVVNDLMQHLPEGLNDPADLGSHLSSPQFRAACSRLNQVFRTGEGNILYNELGLEFQGTNAPLGVQAFLDAIEETYGPEEEEDDEENMED